MRLPQIEEVDLGQPYNLGQDPVEKMKTVGLG
jgi:hypothetical protein